MNEIDLRLEEFVGELHMEKWTTVSKWYALWEELLNAINQNIDAVAVNRVRRFFGADILTCLRCIHACRCEYAFDLYNTNGDCLATK
jgi:hypothetical protein